MAAGAKVWQLTADGAVAMTLADIEPGDWVKVKGKISKDGAQIYTITSIKYRDLTPAAEPKRPPDAAPRRVARRQRAGAPARRSDTARPAAGRVPHGPRPAAVSRVRARGGRDSRPAERV